MQLVMRRIICANIKNTMKKLAASAASLIRNSLASGVQAFAAAIASSVASPSGEAHMYTGCGKHMLTWDAATPSTVNTIRMDTELRKITRGDVGCKHAQVFY